LTGNVRGTVTDLTGTPRAIGRVYLLLANGLNQNIFADVSPSGTFDLGGIPVGAYQLRFWGGTQASVPEPLENPVPITVSAATPTVVEFKISIGSPDETAGDRRRRLLFQEQPFGDPNATVSVRSGCRLLVQRAPHQHTVTGGHGRLRPLEGGRV
jgi:hypothetical protein